MSSRGRVDGYACKPCLCIKFSFDLLAVSFYKYRCFWLGVHGPYFSNEGLFPSAVFLMQFMSHKGEIVLIKRKTM